MTIVDVTPYLFDSLATLWLGYVGRIMKAALFAHLLPSRGWHEYKEPGELEPEKQGEVYRWPQWWCLEETHTLRKEELTS